MDGALSTVLVGGGVPVVAVVRAIPLPLLRLNETVWIGVEG